MLLSSVAVSLWGRAVKVMGSPSMPFFAEGVHQSHSPESSHVSDEVTLTENSPPDGLKVSESGSVET